jgi:cytochrome b pre-mRNA-processing protein 3
MGVFSSFFKPRPQVLAGRALYQSAVAQARKPALYLAFGAPDTPEGRFELYTLHAILLMRRLKRQGAAAVETGDAMLQAYKQDMDYALRDLGVGDLSVGKRMRKLFEAAFGRMKSYDEALDVYEADPESLVALVRRTVYRDEAAEKGPMMAEYAARAARHLAAQPIEALLAGEASWPEVSA